MKTKTITSILKKRENGLSHRLYTCLLKNFSTIIKLKQVIKN